MLPHDQHVLARSRSAIIELGFCSLRSTRLDLPQFVENNGHADSVAEFAFGYCTGREHQAFYMDA
jgi:hypothetical protein